MPSTAHEIVVFVGSPSDCAEERAALRSAAAEVTDVVGLPLSVRIRLTGWEQIPPDLGRPQERINVLVDECDVFIGVLSHSWGTPTGTHSSGFQEEYERAEQRRKSGPLPQVALYFHELPAPWLADPGQELRKVLDFQERIRTEHLALYSTYGSVNDFRQQVWQLLARRVAEVGAAREQPSSSVQTQSTASSTEPTAIAADITKIDDARRQISEVTGDIAQLARGADIPRAVDPDRLLLFSLAINEDGGFIPAHVANRLYNRRAELVLSTAEVRLWQRTLTADIGIRRRVEQRVIPGWALTPLSDTDVDELLKSDDDTVVTGTLRVLERLRRRPTLLWEPGNQAVIVRWGALLGRPGVATAAAEYMTALATETDLPLLDAATKTGDWPRLLAHRSFLAGDPNPLARYVADPSAGSLREAALVAAAVAGIDDEALRALARGSAEVPVGLRVLAFRELERRDKVDLETLRRMLVRDDTVDVVFAAVDNFASPVNAEAISAAAADLPPIVTGDLEERAKALTSTLDELVAQLDSKGYSLDAWEALAWKADPSLVPRARSVYDTDAEELVAPLVELEAWRSKDDLIPFVRGKMRIAALRLLASQPAVAEEDRARVRAEFTRDDPRWRSEVAALLAEIATADDIPALIGRLPHLHGSATREKVIDAVLRMGRADAAHSLLEVAASAETPRIVSAFAKLPTTRDEDVRELLYSETDEARIAALSELVRRIQDSPLAPLLEEYVARRPYFYNVVVELDWIINMGSGETDSIVAPAT